MVIFRSAVGLKEIADIEIKAFIYVRVERLVASLLLISRQTVKIVASVETVYPRLHRKHSVNPLASIPLRVAASLNRPSRRLSVFLLLRVFIAIRQQLAAEQRGVEHGVVAFQRTVGKQKSSPALRAVQIIHHKIRRRQRHVEISALASHLIRLHQCRCAETRRHNRWRKLRKQKQPPRLPVEIIAPARSAVTFRLQRNQQICQLSHTRQQRLPCPDFGLQFREFVHGADKIAIPLQKQAYALRIILLWHHRQTAQIHRAALKPLYHTQPQYRRPLKRQQCMRQSRV